VLPGAGLGDDPGLAHAFGQQGLAEDVVDLVGPGVVEVLTLEVNPATVFFREALAVINRSWPTLKVFPDTPQFGNKLMGFADPEIGIRDPVHLNLQIRRNDASAVLTELALLIGHFFEVFLHPCFLRCDDPGSHPLRLYT